MKSFLPKTLLLTATLLVLNSFFWKKNNYEDDYLPPNMLEAVPGHFVEGRPVSIGQYAEFLADVKRWWSPKFHKERLNQQQWNIRRLDIYYKGLEIFREEGLYGKMLPQGDFSSIDRDGENRDVSYYLEREGYHHLPIINITPEMAKNYAMWKGDKLMIYYATQCADKDERQDNYPRSVYFYPTPQESLKNVAGEYDVHLLEEDLQYPDGLEEEDLEETLFAYKGLKEITEEGTVVSISNDGTLQVDNNTEPGQATGFRVFCHVVTW